MLTEFGQHWGEGATRCLTLEGDFLDEESTVQLMPIPESFDLYARFRPVLWKTQLPLWMDMFTRES